jgi:hypothetical protein
VFSGTWVLFSTPYYSSYRTTEGVLAHRAFTIAPRMRWVGQMPSVWYLPLGEGKARPSVLILPLW